MDNRGNSDSVRAPRAKALIGNSFPLSLVRGHAVCIDEIPVEALRDVFTKCAVASYWGHENTRAVAEAVVGVSLKPATERPALLLDAEGYPSLDGTQYRECFVLSPDYTPGFRPAIGAEVAAEDIQAWHALRLEWK